MRVFVAVDLDDELRAVAARFAETVGSTLKASSSRGAVKWVSPENLHVTIKFLGWQDPDRMPAVEEILRAPLSVGPFDLALGAPGVYPVRGPARVIWVGLESGLSELTHVHREIERRLATCDIPPDDRPFSPHVTLGRLRAPGSVPAGALRRALEARRPEAGCCCRVTHVTLYESRLGAQGPTYVPLLRTPLGGVPRIP